MAEAARKVKVSEKRRGKLIALSRLEEGTFKSFDKTPIYYRSYGEGKNTIVCCNGLGVGTFFWIYLEKMFRNDFRIVTWDYRGHGKSGLPKDTQYFNLQALVRDCKAVVNHLRINKPILIGHSLGVQTILEYYRLWPKDVASMILCFGTSGHPMDNFYNTRLSRYIFQIAYELSQVFPKQSNWVSRRLLKNPLSFWMGGLLRMMHTGMVQKSDMDQYINHILDIDPKFFTSLLKSAQEHSAEDMLKTIKAPTLIVAGELDQFTPMWLSKKMNRLIPKSELFVVQKGTHAALVEQPDLINLRIEKFLKERVI